MAQTHPVRFSDAVEKALAEVCPPRDAFDHPDFDPVVYLNSRFHDESSLAALPAFIDEMTRRFTQTENELIKIVEAQATNATAADNDLVKAKEAVATLYERVADIKKKTAKSENTARELCQHIRALDTAKTNLTVSINTLRSIQLWILQLQALQTSFERQKFIQCRDALLEAQKYSAMFENMRSLPKVKEINDKQAQLCRQIEHCIRYTVFGETFLESSDETLMAEACALADILGKESIRRIRDHVIENMLEGYSVRFRRGTEDSKLERTERRYVYIRTLLEQNERLFLNVFPRHWCVPQELCVTFCLQTKNELDYLLHEAVSNIDVVVLTYVLQKTIDIERDLTRMMAWKEEFPGRSAVPDYKYNGMILSSFKAHMDLFVRNEDKLMGEALSQGFAGALVEKSGSSATATNTTTASTTNNNNNSATSVSALSSSVGLSAHGWWSNESEIRVGAILPVAEDLFIFIKESLKRTVRISQQDVLLDMAAVWRKHLICFVKRVTALLPNAATTREDIKHVCIILNTAEMCQSTTKDLSDEVCTRSEAPAKEVGFEQVIESFSLLYSKGIQSIVHGTETSLTPFFMEYANGAFVNSRGEDQDIHDECAVIRSISTVLHEMVAVCVEVLPSQILRFLLDKVAASVIPTFTDILYRIRRLPSDFAVGLMRVDSAALERVFLQLPNYNDPDRFAASNLAGYTKHVRREFDRLNRTLKVLQVDVSVDTFVDVYYEVMLADERSIHNFLQLVELKGRKREDVNSWVANLLEKGVVEVTKRDLRRDPSLSVAQNNTASHSSAGNSAYYGNLKFPAFFAQTTAAAHAANYGSSSNNNINNSHCGSSGKINSTNMTSTTANELRRGQGFSSTSENLAGLAESGGGGGGGGHLTATKTKPTTATSARTTTTGAPADCGFGLRFAKAARSTASTINFLSNFKKEPFNASDGSNAGSK